MKKRILALLLMAAMTFTLFTACGKNDAAVDTAGGDTETSDTAEGGKTDGGAGETPEPEKTPEAEASTAPDDNTGAEEPSPVPVVPSEQPSKEPEAVTTPAPSATPAPTPTPEAPAATSVDLVAFYWDLYDTLYPVDKDGYGTGPAVDDFAAVPEMLEGFYPGLTAVSTKQCHVFMPMMTGVPYELVLIEAENAADVETIKTILQARIDSQLADRNYPSITENWELNSRIVTNGNYILMAVTSDFQAYIDAFNALF